MLIIYIDIEYMSKVKYTLTENSIEKNSLIFDTDTNYIGINVENPRTVLDISNNDEKIIRYNWIEYICKNGIFLSQKRITLRGVDFCGGERTGEAAIGL